MTFENSFHDAGMVVEKNIAVKSLCSHHLVPTIGKATIAYIPGTKVIGLSKLNRIVDFFARRPQEQERYGMQLWAALTYILETEDVAVYVDAKHYCVSWRGVKDDESSFVTSKLGGSFMTSSDVRKEFYDIARG
jgi:GTP cyclohydrolase I